MKDAVKHAVKHIVKQSKTPAAESAPETASFERTPKAMLLGAVLVLFPKYGVLEWSEAEIPWHLLIFSAGAYAGGLALDDTGAAEWGVRYLLGGMDLKGVPFGVSYTVIIAVMMYSHLLTTSKTVRTLILLPIIITMAKALGWPPIAFA